MINKKRLLPTSYKTLQFKENITSKLFPYYLTGISFNSEKKLNLGIEYKISEIFLLYSLNGIVEYSNESQLTYLYPHDLVLTTSTAPIKFNSVGSDKWEYIYLTFDGSHAKLLYNLIRTKDKILRINPLSSVLDYLTDLLNIDNNASTRNNILISDLLSGLLTELYEESYNIIKSKNQLPVKDTDIKNAMKYISENYKKDISIDSICDDICFSKFYFCKLFKKETGVSIYKYLNEYRINKSKDLLTYSKLTISSIASLVGFKNELNFIRCFKKSLNMTPTDYRKNF